MLVVRKYLVQLLGIDQGCSRHCHPLLCSPSYSTTHAVEYQTGPCTPPTPTVAVCEEGGGRCSSAPARKKGLRDLLFLLSDSIYMGTSGPGVYYVTQAGCEELWRERRHEWSIVHHHGDTVSTESVSCPPGSVRNHTLGCPEARWEGFPAAHRFCLLSADQLYWRDLNYVKILYI